MIALTFRSHFTKCFICNVINLFVRYFQQNFGQIFANWKHLKMYTKKKQNDKMNIDNSVAAHTHTTEGAVVRSI